MIKIENVETVGWEAAIRGMRNPKNSHRLSDSFKCDKKCQSCKLYESDCNFCGGDKDLAKSGFVIGENDYTLMMSLCNAGPDHRKFMRFIVCYADVTAPLYWWKQADCYRAGVEKNSCSTMHGIHEKKLTLNDFSHEHLTKDFDYGFEKYMAGYNGDEFLDTPTDVLSYIVDALNRYREGFISTRDKRYWRYMIQLLPSGYNQKRTMMYSYEALRSMYHARKNHKLDEWKEFCKWIEGLPYSELMTGEKWINGRREDQ